MNLVNQRLGAWTIREKLGDGGQGAVWLGMKYDIDGRQVKAAIKTLKGEALRDQRQREMLAHEYAMIRDLKSPYLARYIDSGIEAPSSPDGDLVQWLALEYVAGQSLEEEIHREGVLDEASWIDLAHDTLAALAALHSKGLIHSDIKPGNIMRSSRKSILVDFGGASIVGIRDRGDQDGGVITLEYAAPEQFDGAVDAKDYGYEIDIFSLGMTLVFAATGTTPWDEVRGRTKAERFSSAREQFEAMKSTPPRLGGLSPRQKELVLQMIQVDPLRRTPAATLLKQVQEYLPDGSLRKSSGEAPEPVRWVPQTSKNSASKYATTAKGDDSQPQWTNTILVSIFGYVIGQVLRLVHFNSNELWRYKSRRAEYGLVVAMAYLWTFGLVGFYQARVYNELGAGKKYKILAWVPPLSFGILIGSAAVANYKDVNSPYMAIPVLAFLASQIAFFWVGVYFAILPKALLKK